MNEDWAYHLGVFMGDGFIENYNSKNWSGQYIGLKSIDLDFVEHWRDVARKINGTYYKIYTEKQYSDKHNSRYRCRSGKQNFVKKTIELTGKKAFIPEFVKAGNDKIKKGFIQGVMDSEAWITALLRSLAASQIALSVGVTDEWINDVHNLFEDLSIKTSKLYVKKPGAKLCKNGKPKKKFFYFTIDIIDYVDSGLGFNIKRKQDRLDYCALILRDYTRDYPRYSDYLSASR